MGFEHPRLFHGVECKFSDGSKVAINSIICPADGNKLLTYSYGLSLFGNDDLPQEDFIEFDLRKIPALASIATLFWRCKKDVERITSLVEQISSTYLTTEQFISAVQIQRELR